MDRRRALARGFTLLELAIVVVIAAVLFAAAAPHSSNRDLIGSAARSVAADAARARSYSARTWSTVTLDVDLANAAWRVTRQDGTWLELPGAGEYGWRTLEPGLAFAEAPGFPPDAAFLPNGRAAAEARVRILSGDDAWVLKVESLSGRISAEPEL